MKLKFKGVLLVAVLVVVGASAVFILSKKEGKSVFLGLLGSAKRSFFSQDDSGVGRGKVKPQSLKVPILLYHYVEDNTDERDFLRTSMATRPYFFEIQMKYLSFSGYTAISPSDLKSAFDGDTNLPEKPVIISFDDGFRDYYYNAFPVLKKYNLHAIVYMIANHIGRSGNLTVEMLREMVDSGVFELGSHTLNHVWLSQVGQGEARREIFESKKVLSDIFNYPVKHFAYPGGFEAPWVVNLVREAGYETAVTTKMGIIQTPDKILSLKRVRVGNLNEVEFTSLLGGERFKE